MVQDLGRGRTTLSRFILARFFSPVAALALAVAFQTPAGAQSGGVYGGPGGRYFEYGCGSGQVLVGLRGSAGVLLDSIQAVCARVGGGNTTTGASTQGPVVGNDRPFDKAIECPPGYAVTAASMAKNESAPHLGAIRLYCTELAQRAEGGSVTIDIQGSGHFEGYRSPFGLLAGNEGNLDGASACPGQYAVGIRGRDDGYVTAFGLMCGPKPSIAAGDPNAGHTLGKRKRPAPVTGPRTPGEGPAASSSIVRDSAPWTGTLRSQRSQRTTVQGVAGADPPAEEPSTPPPSPAGASIFTDSAIPPPQAAPDVQREPPSPLINGTYATTLSVTDSQCLIKDLRGTWGRVIELRPESSITIPLHEYNSIFSGPVMLNVEGLRLSQSTTVPIDVVGSAPATFDGLFTNDGSQFNVRFEAGNALCGVRGTISGVRQST